MRTVAIAVTCGLVLAAEAGMMWARMEPKECRAESPTIALDALAGRIQGYARESGSLPRDVRWIAMCPVDRSPTKEAAFLRDAFGTPIRYEVTGPGSFRLTSWGPDGEPGGEDVFADRPREYTVEEPKLDWYARDAQP